MTKEQLKLIAIYATKENIDKYYNYLIEYMKKYGIIGKYAKAAFLATIIHESSSFKYTKEIASGKAYEGRKNLGNIYSGDGVKYKGRGLIQITGRANYQKISDIFKVDFISNPELLETTKYAVESACWWWSNKNLTAMANKATELTKDKIIENITLVVNGGLNGIEDRKKWYNKALEILK